MANDGAASILLEVARTFRPRILAEREHIEAGRRLPEGLTGELAGAGFFRVFLPAAYGGLDLTPMEAMEVYEELARADASVAWCVWNGNANWTTAQLSKEVAQAVFADPDMILANSTRPSGQAVVVEGGYRVSGRWSLVSGCQLSSWFILMSVVHENGTPRRAPSGAPESRFMLCPAADCEIIDTWTTGGCEAPVATMSWCEISLCRPARHRSTPTRSCCPVRGIGFPLRLALSPASPRWRWASPEARSRRWSISPSTNGMNAPASHCAKTGVRKRGCRRRRLSSVRRGFSCSTPSAGSGTM